MTSPLHSPKAQVSCPNSLASWWASQAAQPANTAKPLLECSEEGPLPSQL